MSSLSRYRVEAVSLLSRVPYHSPAPVSSGVLENDGNVWWQAEAPCKGDGGLGRVIEASLMGAVRVAGATQR